MLKRITRVSQSAALTALLISAMSATGALAGGSHKVFNVQTYGATGNGTTDDSAAIKAAVTAAGANSGATVYFPAGTYLYQGVIFVQGVTFTGQSATLLGNDSAAYIEITGSNSVVENLSFSSLVGYNARGIYVYNAKDFKITNNTFNSGFSAPIIALLANTGTISLNKLSVAITYGMFLTEAKDVSIQQNLITQPAGIGYGFAIYDVGGRNNTIQSNNISLYSTPQNSAFGIGCQFGTNETITNNIINNAVGAITVSFQTKGTIGTNAINNSYGDGINTYFCDSLAITNNTVNNSVNAVGIQSDFSIGTTSITQNQIGSTGTSGIYALGNNAGSHITISGNAISNSGLTATTQAVIGVNQTGAKSISIANNQYKGNTTNLTYFIDCVQPAPVASVTGNKTNTLLPTKVGP